MTQYDCEDDHDGKDRKMLNKERNTQTNRQEKEKYEVSEWSFSATNESQANNQVEQCGKEGSGCVLISEIKDLKQSKWLNFQQNGSQFTLFKN